MSTLASLIQNKFEFFQGVQNLPKKTDQYEIDEASKTYHRIVPAKQPPSKQEWIDCKKYVDNLPTEFKPVIQEKAALGLVEKIRRNKGFELVYEKILLNFKIELNIFETFIGEVKMARYIAYNKYDNVVYTRDILKANPLSQF